MWTNLVIENVLPIRFFSSQNIHRAQRLLHVSSGHISCATNGGWVIASSVTGLIGHLGDLVLLVCSGVVFKSISSFVNRLSRAKWNGLMQLSTEHHGNLIKWWSRCKPFQRNDLAANNRADSTNSSLLFSLDYVFGYKTKKAILWA